MKDENQLSRSGAGKRGSYRPNEFILISDLHLLAYHSIFIYMPQIQIPSPLRPYSGKQATVDVPGKTVGEALSGLVSQHPDLKRHLYTDEGKLRAFVNVYVNDEDMRYLQKEATVLEDGDTISIVPSIAGGATV